MIRAVERDDNNLINVSMPTPSVCDIKLLEDGTIGLVGNVQVLGNLTMLAGKKLLLVPDRGQEIDVLKTIVSLQERIAALEAK